MIVSRLEPEFNRWHTISMALDFVVFVILENWNFIKFRSRRRTSILERSICEYRILFICLHFKIFMIRIPSSNKLHNLGQEQNKFEVRTK